MNIDKLKALILVNDLIENIRYYICEIGENELDKKLMEIQKLLDIRIYKGDNYDEKA